MQHLLLYFPREPVFKTREEKKRKERRGEEAKSKREEKKEGKKTNQKGKYGCRSLSSPLVVSPSFLLPFPALSLPPPLLTPSPSSFFYYLTVSKAYYSYESNNDCGQQRLGFAFPSSSLPFASFHLLLLSPSLFLSAYHFYGSDDKPPI